MTLNRSLPAGSTRVWEMARPRWSISTLPPRIRAETVAERITRAPTVNLAVLAAAAGVQNRSSSAQSFIPPCRSKSHATATGQPPRRRAALLPL